MPLISTTITATRPATLCAGDNPIIIQLSTGSIGSAGYAKGKIRILSTSTNNLTLTFNLTGGTVYNKVFTGKEYPNNDAYFLTGTLKDQNGTTIDSSISTTLIASSLADCLKKDPVLSNNYYIDYSGTTIIELIAKSPGTTYSLAGQVVSSNGSNVSFTSISTGSDAFQGSRIPGYQLYVETYKGDDNLQLGQSTNTTNYKRITETVLPFSPDNIHRFDVSNICKSYVSTPLPNLTTTGATVNLDYFKVFSFAYGEQYPLAGAGTNTTKKIQKGILNHVYVANASLPLTQANNMVAYSGRSSPSTTKFLTVQPQIKKVNKKQKELLSILIPKDLGGVGYRAIATVRYYDGTLSGHTLFYLFTGSTNIGGLYTLNVSYENVFRRLEVNGKRIKTARVIITQGIDYSTTQTYQFRLDEPKDRYGLIFKNSLGCYDTVDFYGSTEATVDRTSKQLTIPLSINQNGSVPVGFKYNSSYDTKATGKIKVNSGWIDEQHYNWLLDLLKSNEIYHYNDDGSLQYLKLESHTYSKSNQSTQYFVECSFSNTIAENNVTV